MMGKIAAVFLLASSAFAAGDVIHSGDYQGEWNGAYGSGNLSMTLERASTGYHADVTMSVDPEDVDCTVESLKIDGANLEMVVEYGNRNHLQMKLSGTLKGRTIEGRFKTVQPGTEAVDDEGTFRLLKL